MPERRPFSPRLLAALLFSAAAAPGVASAAPTMNVAYGGTYVLTALGAINGVPSAEGGLAFKDASTLVIDGAETHAGAALYQIPITRGTGNHVVSIGTAAELFTTPYGDTALAYGPGGVLFVGLYNNNSVGEVKPGSTAFDKTVSLSAPSATRRTRSPSSPPAWRTRGR